MRAHPDPSRQTSQTIKPLPDLRQHLKRPPETLIRGDPKRKKTYDIEIKTSTGRTTASGPDDPTSPIQHPFSGPKHRLPQTTHTIQATYGIIIFFARFGERPQGVRCGALVTRLQDTFDDSFTSTRGLYRSPSQLCLMEQRRANIWVTCVFQGVLHVFRVFLSYVFVWPAVLAFFVFSKRRVIGIQY